MVEIDGRGLTCEDIVAVARRDAGVTVTESAIARAERSFRYAEIAAATRPIYGRSTGVGANKAVAIDDREAHARALLRSHATSAGPLRSAERVRAMLVVRLNQLAAGGSGASPDLLGAVADMLASDALPHIREHGSVGTGDLTALATTALALSGEGPTTNPLMSILALGPHDGLSFLSSNAASIGDAALLTFDLRRLAAASVVVAALTFAAVDGNREAYAEAVERATPFVGARKVCRWLRELTDPARSAARIQDPFGLRAIPQTHGPLLDALDQLADAVNRLANAAAENPLLLANDDPDAATGASGDAGSIAHHGGFHAAYLATALTQALVGAAQSAKLVLARVSMLNEPDLTGLAPFLGDGTPGASGAMLLEYVAASALAEVRAAAIPAGLQSVSLSRGVEDDASFASQAVRQGLRSVHGLQMMVAAELVAAVRAVRLRGLKRLSPLLAAALSACEVLPDDAADRDLTDDLEVAASLLPQLGDLLD